MASLKEDLNEMIQKFPSYDLKNTRTENEPLNNNNAKTINQIIPGLIFSPDEGLKHSPSLNYKETEEKVSITITHKESVRQTHRKPR